MTNHLESAFDRYKMCVQVYLAVLKESENLSPKLYKGWLDMVDVMLDREATKDDKNLALNTMVEMLCPSSPIELEL